VENVERMQREKREGGINHSHTKLFCAFTVIWEL
jgi:hypothetical protein